MPGSILTTTSDFEAIRAYLGVATGPNSGDFSDARIDTSTMLGEAEAFVTSQVESQEANGVPTIADIMAGTGGATARDKTFLKNAVAYYVAYLFAPGETNAVNTSVTLGKINVDHGGIGSQWIEQAERGAAECSRALRHITNWKRWRTL